MAQDPQDLHSLAGRIGAAEKWARTKDRKAATEPARQARRNHFAREVDPEGVLDPSELAVRVAHAQRAYMLRLALKSAKARRARKRGQS
jgi:hypothetical protein